MNYLRTVQYLIVFFLASLFLIGWMSSVFAASSGGISVSPAYVDVLLPEASSSAQIEIQYHNTSGRQVTLELFPIDFRQTSPFGQIGFVGNEGEYSYSLSSFLSFETNRLDLEPGEKKTVSLLASNRKDLSPGGHYAAVVARMIQEEDDKTVVAPAVSTLLYLRKTGGERFHLSLRDVSWPEGTFLFTQPPSTLTLEFQNEGNVHLIPYGEVVVKDIFGRVLMDGVINEGSLRVLPESMRYVPVYLKKKEIMLPLSVNFLTMRGKDQLGKVTYNYADTFIYIHPGMIAVPIGILGAWWLVQRRKRITKNSKNQRSNRKKTNKR